METNNKTKRVVGYALCLTTIIAVGLLSTSLSVPAEERDAKKQLSESRAEGRGEHQRGERRGEHDGERKNGRGEHDGRRGENRGEHGGKRGEHGGESEETGKALKLNESYVKAKNGAHVSLKYDRQSNSFVGTVKNLTGKLLERVRVEIHLSNGRELGPTKPVNLAPGKTMSVKLEAKGNTFDAWSAHAEMGSGEHENEGRSGEKRGEHGRGRQESDRRGEHR